MRLIKPSFGGPHLECATMRQFTTVSFSPWADPYANRKPLYSAAPDAAPAATYRRIILPTPTAPVFFHPGIEQIVDSSDDEDAEAEAGTFPRRTNSLGE